jgi:hypothetical protein
MLSPEVVPAALAPGETATSVTLPEQRLQPRQRGRAPRRGFIGLGQSLFQVFPFQTRRAGEARSRPPRTVGYTSILLGRGKDRLDVGPNEAAEIILRNADDPVPPDAAKEKVVFCSRRGDTLVFQADRQKGTAALCACGNASATAATLLAHRLKTGHVRQDLQVPDGRLEVAAAVTPVAADGWRVGQEWIGIRFQVQETAMHGRPVAVCAGSFNDYLVVRLAGADELEHFDLPEVLDLWQEARSFGGFNNPLQSRLVALGPGAGGQPFAKFYTCGRDHPGAPLTGMATLAMAASRVGWLGKMLAGGGIEHRRGTDALPSVRADAAGYAIGFPAIDVFLKGI